MAGITRVARQRFFDALFDGFDGEVTTDRCPAVGSECFEDDIGVSEDSGFGGTCGVRFLHTVRTSQLERCCKVVLSKKLGQTAQSQTHGFGGFARRQTPVLYRLVQHPHEAG